MITASVVDLRNRLVELLQTAEFSVPVEVKSRNLIYADVESVTSPTVFVAPIDKHFYMHDRNGFVRKNRIGVYLCQFISEKNEQTEISKQDTLIRLGEEIEEWIAGGLTLELGGRQINGQTIVPDSSEQNSIFEPEALQKKGFFYQIILEFTQIIELTR